MTLVVAVLTVLAGLALLHRAVQDLAGASTATWTTVAILFGTFVVPALLGEHPLPGAASFGVAAVALTALRAGSRRFAVAAVLVSLAIPFLADGRLGEPSLWRLEKVLFGSPWGFFSGSPILWAGVFGLGLLARREGRRGAALPGWAFLALLSAASSAGAQGPGLGGRLHGALPPLALGLGAAFDRLRHAVARRPWLPLAAGGVLLTVWNVLLMEQYRTRRIPADLPVSFSQVTETNAALLSRAVGSPLAWPANWLFAWRHRTTPAKYDLLTGTPMFPAPGPRRDPPRVDPDFLAEGWGPRSSCGGVPCRAVAREARWLVPLDEVPSAGLSLTASGPGIVTVDVNSSLAGRLALGEALTRLELPGAARYWRLGVNEIRLSYEGPAEARVAGLALDAEEGR